MRCVAGGAGFLLADPHWANESKKTNLLFRVGVTVLTPDLAGPTWRGHSKKSVP